MWEKQLRPVDFSSETLKQNLQKGYFSYTIKYKNEFHFFNSKMKHASHDQSCHMISHVTIQSQSVKHYHNTEYILYACLCNILCRQPYFLI